MKIKELAQKYKNERPSGLDDIQFLKWVYFEFAKDKAFDEKYYFGNSATTKQIYRLAQRERFITEEEEEKRTIICVSLSYQIKKLMDELGYDCIVSVADNIGDHVYPIITLPDGRRIKYDLQCDLSNIQTHCKTQFFATVDNDDLFYSLSTISDDEQLRIDRAVGYVSDRSEYNNDTFSRLDTLFKNNPNLSDWEKLGIVLSDEDLATTVEHAGYVETYIFYTKKVLPRFFSTYKNISVVICSRASDENTDEKEYTNCIYTDRPNTPKAVYLFSRKHHQYIATPFSKLAELEEDGLVLGNHFGASSAKRLKKLIKQSIKESKNNEVRQ